MSNLKDIKDRITSIQNTQKITKAMKMVAAAKVKKAENRVKAARPFAKEVAFVFSRLLRSVSKYSMSGLKVKRAGLRLFREKHGSGFDFLRVFM